MIGNGEKFRETDWIMLWITPHYYCDVNGLSLNTQDLKKFIDQIVQVEVNSKLDERTRIGRMIAIDL